MFGYNLKILRVFAVVATVSLLIVAGFILLKSTALSASGLELRGNVYSTGLFLHDWGERVKGIATTYHIYKIDYVYGTEPFLITDMRSGDRYSNKESYEIRALSVYRAHDGQDYLEDQPVIFFVHGGGWIDGYRDWYEFVANSFTGEMGWVSVVIDYRLLSDEVFIADEYCPDRETCGLPENEPYRTKAAWYPDNFEDVTEAFRWTVDNIEENGGNADKIFVFGHSAGGHLAALLTTHSNYETDLRPSIRGLVSMSGVYDFTGFDISFWSDTLDQVFKGGVISETVLAEASPITYVISDTVLPPVHVLYSEIEIPPLAEQSKAFVEKLEVYDYDVTSSYLESYTHSSEMQAIEDINETPTQLIVNWILEVLKEKVYLPLVRR